MNKNEFEKLKLDAVCEICQHMLWWCQRMCEE